MQYCTVLCAVHCTKSVIPNCIHSSFLLLLESHSTHWFSFEALLEMLNFLGCLRWS